MCPLKKLWGVVGQENIWANIQKEEAPIFLNFWFEDAKCWLPFLTNKVRRIFFGKDV